MDDLPLAAEKNTAGMAVLALQRALGLTYGFELEIEKGIPLGSGLGGSAASAVAAVVAAAALVDTPLDRTQLLMFAMQGEAVASGSVHVDNIAPSLFGGLVLTVGIDNPFVKQIPVPDTVRCVLVHPHMVLATREARAILSKTVPLSDVIWQQANLAGFLAGCYSGDLALIRASLLDVVIEPQRQVLIPGLCRREAGRARGRRARRIDLRCGSHGFCVGRGAGRREACGRAWSRRFADTVSTATAGFRRSTAPARA